MSVKEPVETPPTLSDLARKIVEHVKEAEDKTLKAAMLLRKVRKRIQSGEAGKVTWRKWAHENIELSPSRLRELIRIAAADDPEAEFNRLRNQNAARQARYRETQKQQRSAPLRNGAIGPTREQRHHRELAEERARLIDWARSAPLEQVRGVLSYINQLAADESDRGSGATEPA